MDCLPQAKRLLLEKFGTPRSKTSVGTPASSKRPATRIGRIGNNGNNLKIARVADPIGVFCRVRPWGHSDEERCVKIINEKQIALTPPDTSMAWKLGTAKEMTYSFECVYGPDADQQTIFENIALPLVQNVMKGKNGLLFAYGVTGSGKTYTMSGGPNSSGVMPRCLDVIFNSIASNHARKFIFKPDRMNGFDTQSQADAMVDKQRELNTITKTPRSRNGNTRMPAWSATPGDIDASCRNRDPTVVSILQQDSLYAVFVTYVEIYNNFVYDLLDEGCFDDRTKKFNLQSKMLREDGNHNVYVNGVTEVECSSSEEAFEVFLRGQKRRKQAHTSLNTESSRSHAIFNIRVIQAPLDSNGEEVTEDKSLICISQLSLVDLAGSERYGRTGATGDRLKEAGNINNSLMSLRKCMDILRENQQSGSTKMVPYRDTKVTHYLKNYFEGEGRVRMIICLNPRNEDYDENLHVMSFAELTREIVVTRPVEKKLDPMTPGRRKANEIFKEARRRIVEDIKIDESEIPMDVNMVYGLGPPLPSCVMTKSEEEGLITNLRRALEMRIKGRAELAKILTEKRHNFRIRLIDAERDVETMKIETTNLKFRVSQLVEEKEKTERVLQVVQFEKNEQETRADELEKENRALKEELENCRMEIRQKELVHLKDKEQLKTDLELQKELNELKADRHLQREEAKLRASYKNKDKTFETIRSLIAKAEDDKPRRSRSHTRRRSFSESMSTTSSEADFILSPTKTRSRVISASNILDVPPSPIKSRSGGVVAANPRSYRSRSSDNDRWIEHTPGQPIKSGTVFQPVMKKKKSLSRLTSADEIVNKASKYCLNLQQSDGDGGLETKLYKGDVIPSRTGGAQVVFNDVEILKQVSPSNVQHTSPSKKRISSSAFLGPMTGGGTTLVGKLVETYDEFDSVTGDVLAERCATGIGHQIGSKRSRRT
ncbi:unnamed protein product [Allacma fusca]|uniref:Kinesin-like protein n=1 Tax=Allacma fusca TaxID=39272 RepID=A0A8J2KBZ2_9HEXA|nr:unnamed protein product [Allacma fusca]